MSEQPEQAPEIRLSDTYLTACLVAAGLPIARTDLAGGRLYFVFRATPAFLQARREYFSGELHVPALKAMNALRDLRGAIGAYRDEHSMGA